MPDLQQSKQLFAINNPWICHEAQAVTEEHVCLPTMAFHGLWWKETRTKRHSGDSKAESRERPFNEWSVVNELRENVSNDKV
nr:uncharacterized protein LOC129384609 isoform X2 [Dermacentor andersoni]